MSKKSIVLPVLKRGFLAVKSYVAAQIASLASSAADAISEHADNGDIHVTSQDKSTWNGKADASHGTHVSFSSTKPVMDGTASVGTSGNCARSDHRHPSDTSKLSTSGGTISGNLNVTGNYQHKGVTMGVFQYSATLTASKWSGTKAPYVQTVTVSGVTASDNGIVGLANSVTDEQYQAAISGLLIKTAQAANSLTIKAYGVKPEVDIPILVSVERL